MQNTQRFLLIVFMFLQCLSPLAHAHVDGLDAGHGWCSRDPGMAQDSTMLEAYEGAVISVQCACPSSESEPLAQDGVPATRPPVVHAGKPSAPVAAYSGLLAGRADCVLPWSQAPPGILLQA